MLQSFTTKLYNKEEKVLNRKNATLDDDETDETEHIDDNTPISNTATYHVMFII